jgi:hypothetical protein
MTPSISPSDPRGRRGPGLAVIDTPVAPPGWEGARSQLVRIVDPLGQAVAWLAPAFGGRCVGFAVRPSGEHGTAWIHLFHGAGSHAAPHASGCGAACTLVTPGADPTSGGGADWQFIERDPTAATLAAAYGVTGAAGGHADDLRLRFSAALADGALLLDLVAENTATAAIKLRLGLELHLVASVLVEPREPLGADHPGSAADRAGAETMDNPPPGAVVRLGGAAAALNAEITPRTAVTRIHPLPPHATGCIGLIASAVPRPDRILTLAAGATCHLAVALRPFVGGAPDPERPGARRDGPDG